MKLNKRFRFSVFQQFIFSYILIVIVVLAALIPLYRLTISAAQERQNDEKLASVQTIANRISNELDSAASLVTILSRSDEIIDISKYHNELTYSEQYKIAKQRRLLQLADTSWENVEDFYIYFSNHEAIMNPNRVWFSYDTFYGDWFGYEGIDNTSWQKLMRQRSVNPKRGIEGLFSIHTMNDFYLKQETYESIIFFIPFPDRPTAGGAMFLLPLTNILDSFGLHDSSHIQVFDSTAKALLDGNEQKKPLPGIENVRIDDIAFTRFTVVDRGSNLTYVILYRDQIISTYVKQAYEQMLLYMILAITAGCLLSALLAYHQYRPVKRIRTAVDTEASDIMLPYQNEYEYFIEAFLDMRRQDQAHAEKIAAYHTEMRRRALDDILLKRYQDDTELRNLSAYVNLPSMYRVVLTHIDVKPGSSLQVNNIDSSMISIELITLLDEISAGEVLTHPLSEQQVVFIIPASIERINLDLILDRLRKKLQAFRDTSEVDIFFILSPIYQDITDLWKAFDEAKNATTYRYHRNENIIFCEDLKKNSHPPLLSEESIIFFKGFILQCDKKRASEFIRSAFGDYYLGSGDFRQLYYSFRGILILLTSETSLSGKCNVPQYSSYLTHDEHIQTVIEVTHRLCEEFNSLKLKNNVDLNQRILNYLEKNYTNPDTYGISVANHFDLNEKYLYSFFKEENNTGLASYLENLRLEHACTLLTTSKKTINEISGLVGFNTSNTFYKAFVRGYGYSPSEYRNMNAFTENLSYSITTIL